MEKEKIIKINFEEPKLADELSLEFLQTYGAYLEIVKPTAEALDPLIFFLKEDGLIWECAEGKGNLSYGLKN